jgi:hypothetical protein
MRRPKIAGSASYIKHPRGSVREYARVIVGDVNTGSIGADADGEIGA